MLMPPRGKCVRHGICKSAHVRQANTCHVNALVLLQRTCAHGQTFAHPTRLALHMRSFYTDALALITQLHAYPTRLAQQMRSLYADALTLSTQLHSHPIRLAQHTSLCSYRPHHALHQAPPALCAALAVCCHGSIISPFSRICHTLFCRMMALRGASDGQYAKNKNTSARYAEEKLAYINTIFGICFMHADS